MSMLFFLIVLLSLLLVSNCFALIKSNHLSSTSTINHYVVRNSNSYNSNHIHRLLMSTETSDDSSDAGDTSDTPIIPTYLPSAMGIDYIPLATMLAIGDFKAADQFTRDNLIKIAGSDKKGRNFVYWTEVINIPDDDLASMERLWLLYSDGNFGYSVQKRVWDLEFGNFENYIRRIGWTKIENGNERKLKWFGQDEFIYDVATAPKGHLPLTSALRGTQLMAKLMAHPLWTKYDWKNYKNLKWGP